MYGSWVSEVIHGKEWRPPLHLGVVTIEKGAHVLPPTTVGQFIFIIYFTSELRFSLRELLNFKCNKLFVKTSEMKR